VPLQLAGESRKMRGGDIQQPVQHGERRERQLDDRRPS